MNVAHRPFRRCLGLGMLGLLLAVAGHLAPVTAGDEPAVKLTTVKYDAMTKQIAAKKAKLTVVDVWATWCGPCKEHFPDFVAMHEKYKDKGIAFASVSVDDVTKPKQLAEATAFLKEKKAEFSNFVLDESMDDAFDKFDISAISAVFMFGPDGKIVRRFTQDDPNHQFTYEEIDTAIQEFLAGKPMTTGEAPRTK